MSERDDKSIRTRSIQINGGKLYVERIVTNTGELPHVIVRGYEHFVDKVTAIQWIAILDTMDEVFIFFHRSDGETEEPYKETIESVTLIRR